MFFTNMPIIDYEFDDGEIKQVENIVVAVNPVDDIYSDRYFDRKILGMETPEELSDNLYRDSQYYWNLLYVNKIVNPFTDWVKSPEEIEEFCTLKYGVDSMHKPRYFVDIASGQTLVGIDEDKVYKYIEDNGEIPMGVRVVTNYEYEQTINQERRNIRVVPESRLLQFNDTFETAMRINSGETG